MCFPRYSLADLSILLCQASSHVASNVRRVCTQISTSVYSQVLIHHMYLIFVLVHDNDEMYFRCNFGVMKNYFNDNGEPS